jgi:CRP-like cAMP-binding protein
MPMSSNRVLSRLSRADFRLLEPHLEAVDLPVRTQLEARGKRVEQVYFLESGIASVVANGERPIEVGIIGREGMTGLSVVMGSNDPVANETYMQMAGNGQRMPADHLRGNRGERRPAPRPTALRALFHDPDHTDRACERA